jgi:cobalt/nickel transport system permease protein
MHLFSEFQVKENRLTNADVRLKMLLTLAILIMVLSSQGVVFPLLIACFCFVVCFSLKISLRVLAVRFFEPLMVAGVLLLLKFFFSGREVLFSFNIFGLTVNGYGDGLLEGLRISSRIMGAVSILIMIGLVTPFTEFMAGLSWLRIPRQFVELLMLAYRYIFVLLEEALVIYNAQKNRLGYSGFRRGLASFGALSGELTLRAFDHSEKTALAMTQRGYTGEMPLALQSRPWNIREVWTAFFILMTTGTLWTIL